MSKNIVFAIAYDFDGTLSADNMQEYEFIPRLGVSSAEFWHEAQEISNANSSDPTLTYMYLMLHKATAKNIPIRYEDFVACGNKIHFFNGVETWFDRISAYAQSIGITVEHYIISSGLREIIAGCSIVPKFKKIFASNFLYDANGVACWPALAINYTTKTQYLYRINKGALDESDIYLVNQYIPDHERHVPFKRMLFIGDGLTDVPCFRLLRTLGGQAIAVYDENEPDSLARVKEIACGGHRSSYIFPTDYSEGSHMEQTVKAMLAKAAAEHELDLLKAYA